PERRPAQLLDFFLDRRRHRGVADVGVDLHEEVAADDHRFELEMPDVGWNDRAPARHLVADEFRRQSFADRDEFHLRRDLALARVVQLRHAVRTRLHPRLAQLRQSARDVEVLRATRVVHPYRGCAALEGDLARRDTYALRAVDVRLP